MLTKLQKPAIAFCEFTILSVAQLGGIGDPTNCACAHDRQLRCRNGEFVSFSVQIARVALAELPVERVFRWILERAFTQTAQGTLVKNQTVQCASTRQY